MLTTALHTRPARSGDRAKLDRLLASAQRAHSHLDWHPPQNWLGRHPFHLAFIGERLVAAFAAPPDPPGVSWIRLAVVADDLPAEAGLDPLWAAAQEAFHELRVAQVNCMLIDDWLIPHLQQWGFQFLTDVVVLRRDGKAAPPLPAYPTPGVRLRPAKASDLNAIAAVDNAAFAPPWQYSRSVIQQAMAQTTSATVAEANGEIVGYQLSSSGPEQVHLARLAVRPEYQSRGIGRALVLHMIGQFERRGVHTITVNTQRNNPASLKVYSALGFELTSEQYGVWYFSF
jgi:ribosomal-protein-alanine N-acetyltransferase